jgi:transcriptional regulator with XRE-family HTH domain
MSRVRQSWISPISKRLLVLGKTQHELAEDLTVSQQAVSGYVNGRTRPHPKRIRKLALALELSREDAVELLTQSRITG